VASIGTGGSAIQYVPEIAPRPNSSTFFSARHLILPKPDRRPRLERFLFDLSPGFESSIADGSIARNEFVSCRS
jgi:cation diffusion facilitator CzcD-associated flavoprotein CzcO